MKINFSATKTRHQQEKKSEIQTGPLKIQVTNKKEKLSINYY